MWCNCLLIGVLLCILLLCAHVHLETGCRGELCDPVNKVVTRVPQGIPGDPNVK